MIVYVKTKIKDGTFRGAVFYTYEKYSWTFHAIFYIIQRF